MVQVHLQCVACLGSGHAKTVLTETSCSHCENMSLTCLHQQILHEGSPSRSALLFPFSHKRKKQWSSRTHPRGPGDVMAALPLHASPSLHCLMANDVEEWVCSNKEPKSPLCFSLHSSYVCYPGLWGILTLNGQPPKSPSSAFSTNESIVSHPPVSGQLRYCPWSTTSSPRRGEPTTWLLLTLPLQPLLPLLTVLNKKGTTSFPLLKRRWLLTSAHH